MKTHLIITFKAIVRIESGDKYKQNRIPHIYVSTYVSKGRVKCAKATASLLMLIVNVENTDRPKEEIKKTHTDSSESNHIKGNESILRSHEIK